MYRLNPCERSPARLLRRGGIPGENMTDDLFDPRLTEHRNPRTRDIDLADPLEIVDLINAEDRDVPEAVHAERERIAEAIEIAVECFKRGGRLIYIGAGTSGRLGVLDATECPPTFGSDPELVQGIIAGGHPALTRSQEGAEDRPEDGAAAVDEAEVNADDFVFGIATSSTTPFVRGALARASELGAQTGFLCCTEPGDEMRDAVDVCVVPLVGPEAIAGSTRMKAGTATKLVLNTLTTGAMVRLGKVYENLMVDLQAMSEKLVDRSLRIVMAASGCSRDEALPLIERAGGSVKLAVVMKRSGVSCELAELYLAESDGFVRRSLELADVVKASDDPYGPYPVAPPAADVLAIVRSALGDLPRHVAEIVASSTEDALSVRPAADAWCAKEHIVHLIDGDAFFGVRLAAMLAEDEPVLASRDDAVENLKVFDSDAREASVRELLQRLEQSRAALLAHLVDSDAADWTRVGRHEEYGGITVYKLLRHAVQHDHNHVEAIRRLAAG
jgi:N-acetylmuramic acid 6-phosphate etherase